MYYSNGNRISVPWPAGTDRSDRETWLALARGAERHDVGRFDLVHGLINNGEITYENPEERRKALELQKFMEQEEEDKKRRAENKRRTERAIEKRRVKEQADTSIAGLTTSVSGISIQAHAYDQYPSTYGTSSASFQATGPQYSSAQDSSSYSTSRTGLRAIAPATSSAQNPSSYSTSSASYQATGPQYSSAQSPASYSTSRGIIQGTAPPLLPYSSIDYPNSSSTSGASIQGTAPAYSSNRYPYDYPQRDEPSSKRGRHR